MVEGVSLKRSGILKILAVDWSCGGDACGGGGLVRDRTLTKSGGKLNSAGGEGGLIRDLMLTKCFPDNRIEQSGAM